MSEIVAEIVECHHTDDVDVRHTLICRKIPRFEEVIAANEWLSEWLTITKTQADYLPQVIDTSDCFMSNKAILACNMLLVW